MDIKRPRFFRTWDFWLLVALLALFNIPYVFIPGGTRIWAFYPERVAAGEIWRILSCSFAHITPYHLFLDCAPFLLLYCTLEEPSTACRLAFVFAADAGSILAALVLSPEVYRIGLLGMSGVTYGIMAVSAIETAINHPDDRARRWTGTGVLAALGLMVAYELCTGRFPFEFLLFGKVGTPVLTCHAGGVAGGVLAFFGCRKYRTRRSAD